jgi:hypothetical protein
MNNLEFICGICGGQLVKIRTGKWRRTIYNCEKCGKNELAACTVCHKPRHLWVDEGQTICAFCATDFQDGKISLKPGQLKKIRKKPARLKFQK